MNIHSFNFCTLYCNSNNHLFNNFLILFQTSHTADIKTSVLLYCGKPAMVTLDYQIEGNNLNSEFRLSYYPHALQSFTKILKEIFGEKSKHKLYGDFKEIQVEKKPAFYIHLIEKQ